MIDVDIKISILGSLIFRFGAIRAGLMCDPIRVPVNPSP